VSEQIGEELVRDRDGAVLLTVVDDATGRTRVHATPSALAAEPVGALDDRGRGDEDARRMTALRLLLERHGLLPGERDASRVARLRRAIVEDVRALDEAARKIFGDEAILDRSAASLRHLGIAARPHGGRPRGTVEVFEWTPPSEGGAALSPDHVQPCSAILDAWRRGERRLEPALLAALHTLTGAPPLTQGTFDGGFEEICGLRWVPLETRTLPPATHTNCFVLGHGELTVVDPGAASGKVQRALRNALDDLRADGHRLVRVLLTHHHGDHVAGAADLLDHGVELWAHAETAARLDGLEVDRIIENDSPEATIGHGRDRYVIHHTPGHAPGHIALAHPPSGALIAGDLVAAVGTIVVNPPDGDMADYVGSLRAAKSLDPTVVYPAHGPPIDDGAGHLQAYIDHRLERERQVVSALEQAAPATPRELVPHIYEDVPKAVWPLAARNVLAALGKLEREGRVEEDSDGRWHLASIDERARDRGCHERGE